LKQQTLPLGQLHEPTEAGVERSASADTTASTSTPIVRMRLFMRGLLFSSWAIARRPTDPRYTPIPRLEE